MYLPFLVFSIILLPVIYLVPIECPLTFNISSYDGTDIVDEF